MTHTDWMRALATHTERVRREHPEDELVVVFDIDGTIVDARYLFLHILFAYDRAHGTRHFHGATAADVASHETSVEEILEPFRLSDAVRDDVASWFGTGCGIRRPSRPHIAPPRRARREPVVPAAARHVDRDQHGPARVDARDDSRGPQRARIDCIAFASPTTCCS